MGRGGKKSENVAVDIYKHRGAYMTLPRAPVGGGEVRVGCVAAVDWDVGTMGGGVGVVDWGGGGVWRWRWVRSGVGGVRPRRRG